MKVSTTILMASLAASGLAHRERHARFHESKRTTTEILEMHKRAVEADPSLVKRCGEMINAGQWGSFPNCFGACEGQCGGSNNNAAPAAPAAAPQAPAAPASSPAEQPADSQPVVKVQQNNAVKPSSTPKSDSPPAKSTSAPSSDSGNSASGGGLIGLAYNDVSLLKGDWLSGDAKWAYNWASKASNLPSQLQFVPMFHKPADAAEFKAGNFDKSVPLLSLNEPDKSFAEGGCATSPGDACKYHNDAFSNFGKNYISSPAVSSDDAPGKGLDWLSQFKSQCGSAHVDFVALHWYGLETQDAQATIKAFTDYVDRATAKVQELYPGKKIWFTEFAAVPFADTNKNAQFLKAVVPLLKKNPAIERAAPFMVGAQGALGSSAPNAAGNALLHS